MPTHRHRSSDLTDHVTPVQWRTPDKWLCGGIIVLLVLNLLVGLIALGPDLWR